MGFLSFTVWQYAAAGAVLAAGPLIIHLLNRRRYRVLEWAAMDFLRQALERNRRILQIRDLVLLVLRTLAVLLFGLAMARPYFAARLEQFDHGQPLHAVLVIDNSLSMAYESLEGSLLDKAKDRAREFIERLPPGSRISVLPAGGSREGYSLDPYDTKENAGEALARIEVVDRTAGMARAINEARRACEAGPDLARRVIFIGDQQALNWREWKDATALQDLPATQVVSVAPAEWENTWISEVRLQDGLADVETLSTVIVQVRHAGTEPRRDLVVTLKLGETVVGEKTVTIEPGLGAREVDFECSFSNLNRLPEPDQPIFVPLTASLAPDRLPADDQRLVAAPVVAALPVVFIDQYGPGEEDVVQGRLGETRHLRKLLAPKTSHAQAPRQLINVRHMTPAQLTRDVLADARLVVVAGLSDPAGITELLREFVVQGGQLLIAAGAEFDPTAWSAAAWDLGQGILPLPLEAEPRGHTPDEGGANLQPFFLDFSSLEHQEYFRLAGVAEADLRELYSEPFFFKAAIVDKSDAAAASWQQSETRQLLAQVELVFAIQKLRDGLRVKEARGEAAEEERAALAEQERQLAALRPNWLVWATADHDTSDSQYTADSKQEPDAWIEAALLARPPRILATYDLPGRPPFLTARRMGRGEVIFCSTGLLSPWNTLPKTNAVLMFDRILRSMIQSTLPRRNLATQERYALPLPSAEQNLLVTLQRPERPQEEPLDVGYLGKDLRGVTISSLLQRGVYRLRGYRPSPAPAQRAAPVWDVPLVVNGDAAESDLTKLTALQFAQIAGASQEQFRWVAPGAEISLAGASIRGQTSWWWLACIVLVLLLVEMSVLAWPTLEPKNLTRQAATS